MEFLGFGLPDFDVQKLHAAIGTDGKNHDELELGVPDTIPVPYPGWPKQTPGGKYKLDIWESERGWGSKIDSTLEFATKDAAIEYARLYNRKFNPPMAETPDWYMYAAPRDYDGSGLGMLR